MANQPTNPPSQLTFTPQIQKGLMAALEGNPWLFISPDDKMACYFSGRLRSEKNAPVFHRDFWQNGK